LHLCENRRPNEEANLAQRRKGGAIYFSKTIIRYYAGGKTGSLPERNYLLTQSARLSDELQLIRN
jgi:hypothetical protein